MKCFACKREIPGDSAFCPFCREPQGFDWGLIDAARAGDQGAVSELYRRTYENVYYTVRALIRDEDTVLDLVQDTFVKAFEHLDKLQDPNKFRAWVKRIGHNLAVDYTRRSRPMLFSQMTEEDSEQVLSFPDERTENLPDVALDRRETARLVNEILGSLSEDQRLVVGMFYYEQRSVREIAQELGVSENTVKSRLFQGRKKIETRVRALEAQGTRLYSLTPVPFLLLLLRNQELVHPPVSMEELLSRVLGELGFAQDAASAAGSAAAAKAARAAGHAGTKAVAHAGAEAAAGTGIKAAAGAAGKALAIKVAALIASAAVVVSGGAYVVHEVVQNRHPETPAIAAENPWSAAPAEAMAETMTEPLTLDHLEICDNGDMHVQYPVFRGEKSAEVNALVYDCAVEVSKDWDNYYWYDYSGNYQCAVTLLNERALSVVFWGETHSADAIGSRQGLRCLNLDLGTMKPFALRDLYRVDDPAFLETVYAGGRYPGEPETCYDQASGNYDRVWNDCRANRALDENIGYAQCFLKPDGVVLSFYDEMAFSPCNHFEVLLTYEALEDLRVGPIGREEDAEPQTEPLTLDHIETAKNMDFSIAYPVFRGEKSEEVNAVVSDAAWAMCSTDPGYSYEVYLSGEYQCAVMLLNDRVLSIAFWGWSYIEGGVHPWTDLVALNLDLETMECFALSDIYRMDDPSFADTVYAYGRAPGEPWTCYSEELYDQAFAYDRDNARGMRYASNGYLRPEGAVFSGGADHFTGSDHIEILVPYEYLDALYFGPFTREELTENRAGQPTLSAEAAAAYLQELQANREKILLGCHGNADFLCVAIADVCGDAEPELLYVAEENDGLLCHVRGYRDGQLLKCGDFQWSVNYGGCRPYALFQLEGEKDVYDAGAYADEFRNPYLRRWTLNAGLEPEEEPIAQAYYPGPDENRESSFAFGTGEVSQAQYEQLMGELLGRAGRVLLYDDRFGLDGRHDAGLDGVPCVGMSYEQALSFLQAG